MRVLVVGGSGKFAKLVVPELVKRGVEVCALIRDREDASGAKENGAKDIRVGDLKDRTSLLEATSDVDGVFHLNPAFAPDEAQLGINMVVAAKESGVKKFVFSSVIHPSLGALPNHALKRPVEEAIYESEIEFTILQPTMFMQNLDAGFPAVRETGVIGLPYSRKKRASYVDYRDVAEAAAIAFTTDRLAYGTFELCAPGMVNREELAALMAEALGRKVEAKEPSFAEWAATAKIPSGPLRDGLLRMYDHYDKHGFLGGNATVLRAVLGREPRTLRDYLKELAAK